MAERDPRYFKVYQDGDDRELEQKIQQIVESGAAPGIDVEARESIEEIQRKIDSGEIGGGGGGAGVDNVARQEIQEVSARLADTANQLLDVKSMRNVLDYGVKNDGTNTEDSLNKLPEGFTYVFPAGTYGVKGFIEGESDNSFAGFKPKNNTKYIFLPGSKIKVLTNDSRLYSGILIDSVQNFELVSPVVEGDRHEHDFEKGGTQEYGHGIFVHGNSTGKIIDPYCYDIIGDGIDIICSEGSDVQILGGKSYNARRNGLSIESGDKIFVDRFWADNTNGINPQVGIDIEPWDTSNILNHITLRDIYCTNNAKGGIAVVAVDMAQRYNIKIENCTIDGLSFNTIQPNTKGTVEVINPKIVGGVIGIASDGNPNATIYNPIINLDADKMNVDNVPGAIYIYQTATEDFTVGSITILDAIIENEVESNLTPIVFYVPNTGENIKKVKDVAITVLKNNLTGKSVSFGATKDFENCKIGDIPNNVFHSPESFYNGYGSLVKKHVTNKGATGGTAFEFFDPIHRNSISEIEFEVVGPHNMTLVASTDGSVKILPFNTGSIYSNTPGSVIKLRYGLDGDNKEVFYVDKMIGTWTGL